MYMKDDVAKLLSDLDALKLDPPLEVGEPLSFGLEIDLYDPVTGVITTACRPHRPDIGETEILLTAAQIGASVAGQRHARLQQDRNTGVVLLDPQANADAKAALAASAEADAEKAQAVADDLKAKAKAAADAAAAAQADADKAKAEAPAKPADQPAPAAQPAAAAA